MKKVSGTEYNITLLNVTGTEPTATGCNISVTYDLVETETEIDIGSTETINNMNITVLDAHYVVGGQNMCELETRKSSGLQVINVGSAKY